VPVFRSALRSLAFFASTAATAALAASTITGTITNKTINKPSAGDTVTLIRLAQGMQEANHTTTDAHGHYSIDVADEGIHLIRVTHDKANYFQPATPGTNTVDLDVYNAAAKVKGVAEEADVMRIQSDASGTGLQVVENIFVKNESTPPMTQFSNAPFDFWLPEGAVIGGSAALAPGGMPVQAAPVPLAEHNHYTFLFPIRPGETRFQISYHLPYNGKFSFAPHESSNTDTVAIMLPKSMTFTPVAGAPYNAVSDEVNAQTFVARNVTPNAPMGFTLSGSGQLPRDTNSPDASQNQAQQQPSADSGGQPLPETQNTMPGRGLQNPLDPEGTRDPWAKYKYWILGGLAVLFAIAAGVILRKPSVVVNEGSTNLHTPPQTLHNLDHKNHHNLLLQTLKEELFALETDRLQNRISEPEYLEQKAAIETVLRRALNRVTA
jgi:hypothetical protein